MYKLFSALRRILSGLVAPARVADPLASMSPRDLADLPIHHPHLDP